MQVFRSNSAGNNRRLLFSANSKQECINRIGGYLFRLGAESIKTTKGCVEYIHPISQESCKIVVN